MKPSVECRKLAEVLREKAKTVDDAELRAEYQYFFSPACKTVRAGHGSKESAQSTQSKDGYLTVCLGLALWASGLADISRRNCHVCFTAESGLSPAEAQEKKRNYRT
jgi:hypothetical protein